MLLSCQRIASLLSQGFGGTPGETTGLFFGSGGGGK